MKRLMIWLVFCLTVVGFAEPWRQQGELWTIGGANVTIPAGLKPKADSLNVVEAEGNGLSVTFQLLSEKEDFKTFSASAAKRLQSFKGIQWSEPQYGKDGDLQMTLRLGQFRTKEVSLEFGMSLFQKGNTKLAALTVQRSGDAPASRIIGQMMNSIQIR